MKKVIILISVLSLSACSGKPDASIEQIHREQAECEDEASKTTENATNGAQMVKSAVAKFANAKEEHIIGYKIKIGLIYNFLKHVDWIGKQPSQKTKTGFIYNLLKPEKSRTANICIAGDKKFSEYFSEYVGSHEAEIKINIKDYEPDNISDCHILFIGKAEQANILSILAQTKGYPVLTVSDVTDFADKGGIIEIVRVRKDRSTYNYKLRLNIGAAEANNLKMDDELLKVAREIVKSTRAYH